MKNKKSFIHKLNKFVASIGTKLAQKSTTTTSWIHIKTTARFKMKPITVNKLVWIVGRMKNTKAEGYDKLSIEIIKMNIDQLKNNITTIVNKCMEIGTVPLRSKFISNYSRYRYNVSISPLWHLNSKKVVYL